MPNGSYEEAAHYCSQTERELKRVQKRLSKVEKMLVEMCEHSPPASPKIARWWNKYQNRKVQT